MFEQSGLLCQARPRSVLILIYFFFIISTCLRLTESEKSSVIKELKVTWFLNLDEYRISMVSIISVVR
jgi:hypothetical protein